WTTKITRNSLFPTENPVISIFLSGEKSVIYPFKKVSTVIRLSQLNKKGQKRNNFLEDFYLSAYDESISHKEVLFSCK
ncbi:hypothetical protein ACFJXO_14465, partial [Enterococcus faecalis]